MDIDLVTKTPVEEASAATKGAEYIETQELKTIQEDNLLLYPKKHKLTIFFLPHRSFQQCYSSSQGHLAPMRKVVVFFV